MKKKKPKPIYSVYSIKYNDIICYVGLTNNIKTRTATHNRLYRKEFKKELYDWLRTKPDFDGKFILNVIRTFENRTEGKRFETLLILTDLFSKKELKQTVPRIRD